MRGDGSYGFPHVNDGGNYAVMTSVPAYKIDGNNWYIPFSSPITFTFDYDELTTPVLGALGLPDAMQRQPGFVSQRIYVSADMSTTGWNGRTSCDPIGFEFDGNRAEITFTPKDFYDRYLESLRTSNRSSERDYYNDIQRSSSKQEALKKNVIIRLWGVALVGSELTDIWTGGYDTSGTWSLSINKDLCLPPFGVGYVDAYPDYRGGTVQAFRMITLSTCLPPTDIQLSQSSAAPGRTVTLSWSGAERGEDNNIVGYQIYRATSADGEYTLLTSVSSTETSGHVTVTAPTTNGEAYYYKIVTVGSVDGYNSAKSAVYATLVCDYANVSAPTTLTLDTTNVEPGAEVILRWSGAAAGSNNPIYRYDIGRSTSADGEYLKIDAAITSATSGYFKVTAPENNGEAYYYKVRTIGTLEGTDSGWSEAYAMLACTYSAPNAPTSVHVNGAKSVYVLPGTMVTLEWSGATDGANNKITVYDILRNGEVYISSLTPDDYKAYEVPAHDTAGNAYAYSIVARGTYPDADSAPSAPATVYSYTDPTPPTTVNVSTSESYVGGRVLLSWSGAAAGGYNDIVGYRVYRSDTVNGEQTLVASVSSKETSGSCYVDAPATTSGTYYFRVVTVGSYSNGQPSAYATVTASGDAGEDSEVTVIIKPKVVSKRRMVFGDYDTARDGQWTLTGWSFEEPEVQTSFVEVPWYSMGSIDMSTVLTGGDPRYSRRTLNATFECSEGTRDERNAIISEMVNKLHGRRLEIVLPDDPTRYIVGRVSVTTVYSDLAHASVSVTANCEPWRYKKVETCLELLVTEAPRTDVLCNSGRKVLVPELTVTGYNARVSLSSGDFSWTLTPGKYRLPDLRLPTGNTVLTYSGSGEVTITYREAIL